MNITELQSEHLNDDTYSVQSEDNQGDCGFACYYRNVVTSV